MRFIVLLLFFIATSVLAQTNQKTYTIKFADKAPKIDGVLDDIAWKDVDIATNFVMFRPSIGDKEPENLKTEVKLVYDNKAIYIAAYLHDDKPDEIPMEFQTRDNFGNADFFGISLNPSNDGINQTEFFVMSTGNQNDAKVLPGGEEDFSWNAVWYSEVNSVDDGWIVEMKIPYAALRFSNDNSQVWSMNLHRRHAKTRDQYSWNLIELDKGDISQFDGLLVGIKNIEPPTRLNFSPYLSTILSEYNQSYDFDWNVGMDLKYGISESFTLDATLIPDFGQTDFDNIELNLGPFEQKYSEKRQFFTEGLDLFSKGDFLYTRRVGNTPIDRYNIDLDEDEVIVDNPDRVNMLNAVKVSGRTKKGLGIGIFNAITEKTEATIETVDENDDVVDTRKVVTEPLTNYNVIVLDQQFNKNSSISLVSTNVLRKGSFRDANVTGILFDLKTKNSKYGIEGGIAMSNISDVEDYSGFEGVFEIGKVSGKHRYNVGVSFRDKDYDKNDLGYQRKNNFVEFRSSYSYRIFKPKGIYNNYFFNFWLESNYLSDAYTDSPSYAIKSDKYTGSSTGVFFRGTTKKQLTFGIGGHTDIDKQYDYYEPNVEGRYYVDDPFAGINAWISTDYRKRLAIDTGFFVGKKFSKRQSYAAFKIAPRYRINNNISILYSFNLDFGNNQIGRVTNIDDTIIFGKRNTKTVENSITSKYSFNTKSSLGLKLRHYWSEVDYRTKFYYLNLDGSLFNSTYHENEDINFNIWNFDLSYSLEFAPGSQLSILYRNSINLKDSKVGESFTSNIDSLFKNPLLNQLSFKLIYYLDYNSVKTWF